MPPETVNMGTSLGYIYKILDELDEKSRQYAKKLHDLVFIYALYGALDGLSISYSTAKYCFDLAVANTNIIASDLMHDWMMTPVGIATMVVESSVLITFSLLANSIDDEEKDAFKKYSLKLIHDRDELLKNNVIEENSLYCYLKDNLFHCMIKNKQGKIEEFILKDAQLGVHAIPIKIALNQQSNNLTGDQIAQILTATTTRDYVQSKYFIYIGWRYCRDALKGLKNAYKGIRGGFFVVAQITGHPLYSIVLPVGVTLGVMSALNRMWLRSTVSERKAMQDENKYLFKEIMALSAISSEKSAEFLFKIRKQSDLIRYLGLVASGYGGLVDGLYLYMGVLALSSLSPPIFMFVTIFSVLFAVTCIATRLYEEYSFQRKLVSTALKVKLAISGKRMETLFADLQSEQSYSNEDVQQQLKNELFEEMKRFEALRRDLYFHMTLSMPLAVLAGLKNGLAANGAIASVMFAVATINAMLLIACPPQVVISCVVAGMACLIGFLAHSVINNQSHLEMHHDPQPNAKLNNLLEKLKLKKMEVANLDLANAKQKIMSGMAVDPSPQFFFQEWSEVARSFFSGLGKGQKSVDYTLNPLQEADEKGHYRDTPVMFVITILSSTFYGIALALRALARGFGRDPIEKPSPQPVVTAVIPPLNDPPPMPVVAESIEPEGAIAVEMLKELLMDSEAAITDNPASIKSNRAPSPLSSLSLLNRSISDSALVDESQVYKLPVSSGTNVCFANS